MEVRVRSGLGLVTRKEIEARYKSKGKDCTGKEVRSE